MLVTDILTTDFRPAAAGYAVLIDQPAEFNRLLEEFRHTLGREPSRG
jgi:hypothetical protein